MKKFILLFCFSLFACQTTRQDSRGIIIADQSRSPRKIVEAKGVHYAISSQANFATLAAQDMFSHGGNIIDALVAASFVVSVERPQSTGIGGGGFLLYYDAKKQKTYAIDFRERAPLKAKTKMYLDATGKPNPDLSRNGILAAATPGMVAGLLEIHKKFGVLPLKTIMEPAISLAKNGLSIYPQLAKAMKAREEILARDPEAKRIFLDPTGHAWNESHVLVQEDLAKTLELISQKGAEVFYKGEIAQKIADFSLTQKGLLTKKDLAQYKVKWHEPVVGEFNGYEILSMPPPSSGGIHVIQFLNFLSGDHLAERGILSPVAIHLAAASLQSAFADRVHYLGDPAFVKVPTKNLLSKKYSLERRKQYDLEHAKNMDQVSYGKFSDKEFLETTHISIMDDQGNAVSSTQTVNGWMGAAVVVPGTGFLLNNEMDDFAAAIGDSNLFGAIGGEPNLIQPAKTPLSSMSPTIVMKDKKPVMVVGAPGGTRIISCVAQTILNYLEFKEPLYESVAMIRYHHQWKPDVLTIDPPGPSSQTVSALKNMGYNVQIEAVPCNIMAVAKEGNEFHAVADPRDIGTSRAQ